MDTVFAIRNDGRYRQVEKRMLHLIMSIQDMVLAMWYARNSILHGSEDNLNNLAQHMTLDTRIDDIFRTKPHDRLLTHAEVIYFNHRTTQSIKQMRLKKKQDWVIGADLMLDRQTATMDRTMERFENYFLREPG